MDDEYPLDSAAGSSGASSLAFWGWAQCGETRSGSLPPLRVAARHVARLAAALFMTCSVGCTGKPNGPKPPCDEPTPAFRLEASASGEPLPEGLTVTAEYGGAQSESYRVGDDEVGEVACCMTVAAANDAPRRIPCGNVVRRDAAVTPNVIVCDLWTNGAVNLSVALEGETLVDQTLQAKLVDEEDDCGQFATLTARWVLGQYDAGVLVNGF